MIVEHDLAASTLRIDAEALADLESGDLSAFEALEGCEDVRAVVSNPVARLAIQRIYPRPEIVLPGWIGPEMTVLTSVGRQQPFEILTLPTTALPTALARLLDVSARPLQPYADVVRVNGAAFRAWLDARIAVSLEQVRNLLGLPPETPEQLVHALAQLPQCYRAHWRVSRREGGSDGETGWIDVIDGGSLGFWQVLATSFPGDVLVATSTAVLVFEQFASMGAWPREFAEG